MKHSYEVHIVREEFWHNCEYKIPLMYPLTATSLSEEKLTTADMPIQTILLRPEEHYRMFRAKDGRGIILLREKDDAFAISVTIWHKGKQYEATYADWKIDNLLPIAEYVASLAMKAGRE